MGSRTLERSNHRVLAYDARGHGRSAPAADGRYDYPRLVEDLLAVLDGAGIERATLAGVSMGAHTAAGFALAHPERVSALCLITPAFDPTASEDAAELEQWDRLAAGLRSGGVEGFVEAYDLAGLPATIRPTVETVLRQRLALHQHPGAVADALEAVPRSRPFESLSELETLDVPTLIVASRDELDPGHPLAVGETWARAIPTARLEVEPLTVPPSSPIAWQGGRLSKLIAELIPDEYVITYGRMSVRDWDGSSYDRISATMEALGRDVLERLELNGDELVFDAGCGSGRITEALIERLPRGQVIGLDQSESMIQAARKRLGAGAELRVCDLLELELEQPADAILSTATFHWIADHPRLFARLRAALQPGGRLVAQCGGRGNIDILRGRAREDLRTQSLYRAFRGLAGPLELRRPRGNAGAAARGRVLLGGVLAEGGSARARGTTGVPQHDRPRPSRPAPACRAARALHGRCPRGAGHAGRGRLRPSEHRRRRLSAGASLRPGRPRRHSGATTPPPSSAIARPLSSSA